MQMIAKDQFVKQISDILEYYDRPQYSEQIEESLTMLTCLLPLALLSWISLR